MTIRELKTQLATFADTDSDGHECTVWMPTLGRGGALKQVDNIVLLNDVLGGTYTPGGDIVFGGRKRDGAT